MFCHTKIFIDNRKETKYAGFITHLHLLLHVVTLDIEALVVLWHQFTYSLLLPEGCLAQHSQTLRYCKCSVTISYTIVRDTFRTLFVHFANCEKSVLSNNAVHLLLQCVCDDRGSPWSLSVMNICSPIPKHRAPFSDTGRVHNMFTIDCNKSSVNFTGSNVFRLQKPNHTSHQIVGGIWYRRAHCHNLLLSQCEKVRCTNCTR